MKNCYTIAIILIVIVISVFLIFQPNYSSREGYWENDEYASKSDFTGLYGGKNMGKGAGDYPVYSQYHKDCMSVDGHVPCPYGQYSNRIYENGVHMCCS